MDLKNGKPLLAKCLAKQQLAHHRARRKKTNADVTDNRSTQMFFVNLGSRVAILRSNI
jgi:hypothetical protein